MSAKLLLGCGCERSDIADCLPDLLGCLLVSVGRHLSSTRALSVLHDVEQLAVAKRCLNRRVTPIVQVHTDVPSQNAFSVAILPVTNRTTSTCVQLLSPLNRLWRNWKGVPLPRRITGNAVFGCPICAAAKSDPGSDTENKASRWRSNASVGH